MKPPTPSQSWIERIQSFVGEIECDSELDDEAYLEVLVELSELVRACIDAKREEMSNR